MRTVELGPDAWLIHTERPLSLAAAIPRAGLEEVVPGADCVLVRGPAAARVVADLPSEAAEPDAREPIVLPAEFAGEDLGDVAEASGMSPPDVARAVRETTFIVAFCGFAPGFAYLDGLPRALHLPRRDRPRSRVPAGAIAIASGYCAVYPTDSPGGWHLIGHCEAQLFDPMRTDPALLSPGRTVRFA